MAIVFTSTVKDLLQSLLNQQELSGIDSGHHKFEEIKKSIAHYVMDHDELPENSQTIQQILNSPNVEHIEIMLRNNLNYCDECLLKMYRRLLFK